MTKEWDDDYGAHVATWMVAMSITNLKLSFADSEGLKMSELRKAVPNEDTTAQISIDDLVALFLDQIRFFGPTWEAGVTAAKGTADIRAVVADGNKTLKDLAHAVDKAMRFEDEIKAA